LQSGTDPLLERCAFRFHAAHRRHHSIAWLNDDPDHHYETDHGEQIERLEFHSTSSKAQPDHAPTSASGSVSSHDDAVAREDSTVFSSNST